MSAIVTEISKSIATARVRVTQVQVEEIDFRVEAVGPNKAKQKKFQLIRTGHPTVTGTEEQIRKQARELGLSGSVWRVSCRGYADQDYPTEELADAAADKIRAASSVHYTTKLLPASKGLVIVPMIISLFGEALTALFMAPEGTVGELIKNPKVVAAVVSKLAERASERNGLSVLRDLMIGLRADKVRIGEAEVPGSVEEHFDTHFAGRFGHLVEVALWIAQENFLEP
jgi:hypothetical protein